MKVRKFFLRLLFLPGIRRFVDKRWLCMMYWRELGAKDILDLREKTIQEIKEQFAAGREPERWVN